MSDWTKHGVRVGPVQMLDPIDLGVPMPPSSYMQVAHVGPNSITFDVPQATADEGRETYRRVYPPLPPEPR